MTEGQFEVRGEAPSTLSPKDLGDIRSRLGILLKSETVSFLLGAGASVDCGGQIISNIPKLVEQDLIDRGIIGKKQFRVREWLRVFYLAVRHCSGANSPVDRQYILSRRGELDNIGDAEVLKANFEQVLATLYRWRAAISGDGSRLRVDSKLKIDVKRTDLDACIENATHALARTCVLPTSDKTEGLEIYKIFIRKLLDICRAPAGALQISSLLITTRSSSRPQMPRGLVCWMVSSVRNVVSSDPKAMDKICIFRRKLLRVVFTDSIEFCIFTSCTGRSRGQPVSQISTILMGYSPRLSIQRERHRF